MEDFYCCSWNKLDILKKQWCLQEGFMSPYWHLQNQISAEIPALASKSTECDVEIGIFQPTEIQLYLLLWKFGHRTNECVGFLIIIQVDLNLTPCSDYFKRDPTLLCHQLCTSACSVIICCWPDKAEMYPPRKEESYSVRAAISAILLTARVSGVLIGSCMDGGGRGLSGSPPCLSQRCHHRVP